jgi:hypothetical protein
MTLEFLPPVSRALAVTLAAALLLPLPAQAEDQGWLVAPYAWLPSITLDSSAEDSGGGGISASELIDKTDAAGMIRLEAGRNRFGVLVDYIFLGVSDTAFTDALPGFPQGVDFRAELDLTVLELAGIYRLGERDAGVDLLFGARRIGSEQTLLATPTNSVTQRRDIDESYTDVMLGARYQHQFNDRWHAAIRGDISFGDSEGTLNGLVSIGYNVAGPFTIVLGYRHASLEYEDTVEGITETTEIDLSGGFLGAAFRF